MKAKKKKAASRDQGLEEIVEAREKHLTMHQELKAIVEGLDSSVSRLRTTLVDELIRLHNLETTTTAAGTGLMDQLAAGLERIAKLEAVPPGTPANIEGLTGRVEALEQSHGAAATDWQPVLNEIRGELKALNDRVNAQNRRITALEKKPPVDLQPLLDRLQALEEGGEGGAFQRQMRDS